MVSKRELFGTSIGLVGVIVVAVILALMLIPSADRAGASRFDDVWDGPAEGTVEFDNQFAKYDYVSGEWKYQTIATIKYRVSGPLQQRFTDIQTMGVNVGAPSFFPEFGGQFLLLDADWTIQLKIRDDEGNFVWQKDVEVHQGFGDPERVVVQTFDVGYLPKGGYILIGTVIDHETEGQVDSESHSFRIPP